MEQNTATHLDASYEGTYPVGRNGCWHGGLHFTEDPVYPFFSGSVAACKIQKKYHQIAFLERINQREWEFLHSVNVLKEDEDNPYRPDDANSYKMPGRSITQDEYDELTLEEKQNCEPSRENIYVLKDQGKPEVSTYS